tara:strand:+ start:59 stop:1576 length:1518 start_codon:yes stop_codon:yes gene_type:complete
VASKVQGVSYKSSLLDYSDLFGDDFAELVKVFDEALTPQLENLLISTMDSLIFDVNDFSNNINKTVSSMSNSGMSMDLIEETLEQDMLTGGKVFGKLRNGIKEGTVGAINKSSSLGQFATYAINPNFEGKSPDKIKYMWVTVAGHRVCQDCAGRMGDVATFAEWESRGMPGAGATVCGAYCYCIIDPIGGMGKSIDAPVTPEPNSDNIKLARAAALKKVGKLSTKQKKIFNKAFDLTSPNALKILMNKGVTKAEALKQIGEARLKLQSFSFDTKDLYWTKTGQITIDGKVKDVGVYARDRAILHSRIARKIVQDGKIAGRGEIPDFLMTGGYPGAGKSTMMDEAFSGWRDKYVHVDSDGIKSMLAAFDDTKITWNAGLYHEEADDIIKMIFQQSYNQRRHILFDGTMKTSKKMVDFVEWFSTKGGYKPTMAFVKVDLQVAIERAIGRALNNGRFVEPAYILSHLGQNEITYNLLKQRFKDIEYIMYDNNVWGRDPLRLEFSSFFD